MLSTSARLLRLAALLQSRRHWPGTELAAHLEIDARTLRRDIDRLRSLGYPIDAFAGRGGGYSLGRGSSLPPLALEDHEAVTLAVALRAATATVAGLEESARELLAKLDQWLPARLRRRASALHDVTLSLDTPTALADAAVLTAVAAACRDRRRLQFGYRKHDGSGSARSVEPARLISYGRRWYLVAWDCDRLDWRTYRADRIQPPIKVGEAFIPHEAGFDFLEHVRRAIAWSPFDHRITVRLHGSAAALAEAIPPWCGVLVAETGDTALLHVGAGSPDSLLATLGMVGRPFEVVEGQAELAALRQALAHLALSLGTAVPATAAPCRPPPATPR